MNSFPMKSNNNPNNDAINSFFAICIFFSFFSHTSSTTNVYGGFSLDGHISMRIYVRKKFYADKRKLFRISKKKKVWIKLFENDFLWSECQLFWLHNPKFNFSFYTHNRDLASPKWNFSGIKFREFENIAIFVPERLTFHSCSIIILKLPSAFLIQASSCIDDISALM